MVGSEADEEDNWNEVLWQSLALGISAESILGTFQSKQKNWIQTLNLYFSFDELFNAKQNNAVNSFNFQKQDLFFINLFASKQISSTLTSWIFVFGKNRIPFAPIYSNL